MKFEVGKTYRITRNPEGVDDFGGCDVREGDVFQASAVDGDGDVWSVDVSRDGVKLSDGEGWCVAGEWALEDGSIVPVEAAKGE